MVAILKPSGGQLEVLFRPILGYLSVILGVSWNEFGPSWAPWGPPWAMLGPCWTILGHLEAISCHPGAIFLGPFQRRLGAILEPSRDHIGTVLWLFWALFG
jgi:hypothetical protein